MPCWATGSLVGGPSSLSRSALCAPVGTEGSPAVGHWSVGPAVSAGQPCAPRSVQRGPLRPVTGRRVQQSKQVSPVRPGRYRGVPRGRSLVGGPSSLSRSALCAPVGTEGSPEAGHWSAGPAVSAGQPCAPRSVQRGPLRPVTGRRAQDISPVRPGRYRGVPCGRSLVGGPSSLSRSALCAPVGTEGSPEAGHWSAGPAVSAGQPCAPRSVQRGPLRPVTGRWVQDISPVRPGRCRGALLGHWLTGRRWVSRRRWRAARRRGSGKGAAETAGRRRWSPPRT